MLVAQMQVRHGLLALLKSYTKRPKLILKQSLKICQSWRENTPKHACFLVVVLELSG